MNKIFKWFTYEGSSMESRVYAKWFANAIDIADFTGIDKVLACFIKYCGNLGVTPKKEYLSTYLEIDGKTDVKKYNIKLDTMDSYDYTQRSQLEAAMTIIVDAANTAYDEYIKEDLEGKNFKIELDAFMKKMKTEAIRKLMIDAYTKLDDGTQLDDIGSSVKVKLAAIDEEFNPDKIKDIDYAADDSEEGELHFLCPTGLPCVDGDLGGVYTRLIVTLNAQPGGGKTRMALVHWVYKVLTEAKKDVLFYETELTEMQVKNILIAHHIVKVFGGKIKIPDSLMNKKKELSPEQLSVYESAKIDLFESGKYGRLIIKEQCVVERYEEEAELAIATNNIGLIGIDYMGLCESIPDSKYAKSKEQYDIITEAYVITRRLLKKHDISAICINQYNDKGIEAAYAGRPIRSGYVQGGHIVQRHTDYDLSMTFTEEQELANVRTLSVSKRRGTAGFKNVLFSCDLSVSLFKQELVKT